MPTRPEAETEPLEVIAAHILERLDSVEQQLSMIRNWAELLIARGGVIDE